MKVQSRFQLQFHCVCFSVSVWAHFHEVSGEVHGHQVVVEEEVLWDVLQTAASEVGLQRVL